MIKKLIMLAIILLFIGNMSKWLSCSDLNDQFHLSPSRVNLQIIDAVHNDGSLSSFIVRFFHNKPVYFASETTRRWISFWNINFLINFITLLGTVGIMLGGWYLIKRKIGKVSGYIFTIAIFLSLVETILTPRAPFIVKLSYLQIPLLTISFMGWQNFLNGEGKKRYFIAVGIIAIMIWWQNIFPDELEKFCRL